MAVFPMMDRLRESQANLDDLGVVMIGPKGPVLANSVLLHRMAAKETTAFDLDARAGAADGAKVSVQQ